MSTVVGSLEIQLFAGIARLQKDMDDAKRLVGGSMEKIEGMAESVKTTLGSIGVGLSVAGLLNLAQRTIESADHLNDLTKSTNLTVQELSGLKLLAAQTGGSLESLTDGILKMSVAIGKEPEKFKALGITAKDVSGQFAQLSDVFNNLTDVNQRNALTQAVFGKSWKEMAPALSEGSKSIGDIVEKGGKYSKITAEMAKQSDEFNDRLAEFKAISEGTSTALVAGLLPRLNQIGEAMLVAAREAGLLKAALVGIGGLFAGIFTDDLLTRPEKIAKDLKTLQDQLDAELSAPKWALWGETQKAKHEQQIAAINARMLALNKELAAIQATEAGEKEAADSKEKLTEAQKKAAAAAAEFLKQNEEAAKAYDSIVDRVNEHNAQLEKEAGLSRALTEAEKIEIAAKEKLGEAMAADLKAAIAWGVEKERQINLSKEYVKAVEAENKVYADSEMSAMKDYAKAQQDATKSYGDLIDKLELEAQTLGMTSEERERYIELKRLDREYTIGLIETEEDYKARVAEVNKAFDKRDSVKQQVELFKSMEQAGHDAFMHIGESGRDTFQRLQDTLKNGLLELLYQMTIKKWIIQIQAQTTTTGSSGGGGGFGGIFDGILNAFGMGGGGDPTAMFADSSNAALSADALAWAGFADGGSFTVGGSGGTDTTPVQFMATPGETVTIETPSQRAASGGGSISISMPVSIDARGADPSVIPRINQALAETEARIYRNVPAVVRQAQIRKRSSPNV